MNRIRYYSILAAFLVLVPTAAFARGRAFGYCSQGGIKAVVSGLNSTNKFMGSYPGCTVDVYAAGTLTHILLYADNSGTPKANPFTADATSGYWFWYADNGRYDVKLSGGGITTPFTLGDISLADPAALKQANCASSVTIQACHDSLIPFGGGTMYFPAGKYDFTNLNLTLSVTLLGDGPASIIRLADNTNTGGPLITDSTPTSKVTFQNLTLDGNRVNNSVPCGNALQFTGGAVLSAQYVNFQNINCNAVISSKDALGVRIVDNTFTGNSTIAIALAQTTLAVSRATVSRNTISFNAPAVSGCTNATPPICATTSPHLFYLGQTISLRNTSVTAYNARWNVTPITATTFSINTVAGGISTGGNAQEGAFGVSATKEYGDIISENNIYGNAFDQIGIAGGAHNKIIGNVLIFGGEQGMTASQGETQTDFIANTVFSPFSHGIDLSDAVNGPTFITLEGNIVTGAGSGGSPSLTGGVGIHLCCSASVSYITIRGGRITNSRDSAININLATNTVIENVDMKFNNGTPPFIHDGTDANTRITDFSGAFTFAMINSFPSSYGAGSTIYCSDCTIANPTLGAGNGAITKRLNGVWVGN